MRKIFKFSINFWPVLAILFVLFLLFNLTPLTEIAEAAKLPTIDDFKLNIDVPGMPATAEAKGNLLGAYIQAWFQFLLSVIGIIATVMIMIGGFKYLTSQGDKGKIQDAQNMMISAITGLILAFGSVAILGLVNPKLLTLTMPPIGGIDYKGTYVSNRGGKYSIISDVDPQSISRDQTDEEILEETLRLMSGIKDGTPVGKFNLNIIGEDGSIFEEKVVVIDNGDGTYTAYWETLGDELDRYYAFEQKIPYNGQIPETPGPLIDNISLFNEGFNETLTEISGLDNVSYNIDFNSNSPYLTISF